MSAEFQTNTEMIVQARQNASQDVWNYISGGTESETTMRRNRLGLDSLALRPRILRDVHNIDTSATVLGHKIRIPVMLAPMGSLPIMTPQGSLAVDEAAAKFGTINFLSSVTKPGVEEVADNSSHPKIYQLYVRDDLKWAEELLKRVRKAGYAALTLTVDATFYGNRERQLMAGWLPPTLASGDRGREYKKGLTWETMDVLKELGGLPFILKGVATAEDAALAVEHGCAAVYISNHGGRELDYGEATIDILPEIVAAVGGNAEIYIDGGFLRGTDIIKALALGANAACIGKLQA